MWPAAKAAATWQINRVRESHITHHSGLQATSRDEMCVCYVYWIPAPWVPGVPTKTRFQSSTPNRSLKLHLFMACACFLGGVFIFGFAFFFFKGQHLGAARLPYRHLRRAGAKRIQRVSVFWLFPPPRHEGGAQTCALSRRQRYCVCIIVHGCVGSWAVCHGCYAVERYGWFLP